MKAVILESLGAAETVTGSKHLLRTPEVDILIDCGLFQGMKSLREQNWVPLGTDAHMIDVMLLTHAHLDHCGYIPLLVKYGFKGKIYMSKPTMELAQLILLDSAKLQEEEAENANRHNYTRHKPAKPLYTVGEAKASFRYFVEIQENIPFKLSENCWCTFRLAGHILGACSILIDCYGKKILFSGDIGKSHSEILPAPDYFTQADYVIMESTYGDRLHGELDAYSEIATHINHTIDNGGNVIIPSFAVGRAQELLYILHVLKAQGRIANDIPVILDSPMSAAATEISTRFADDYLKVGQSEWTQLLDHVRINKEYSGTARLVNDRRSKIIVAASGMLTGGRVLEYLKHDIGKATSTILLIGFQAEGTRGRSLLNQAHELKIHGKYYQVKAKTVEVLGLSAHADQSGLLTWLRKINGFPKLVMLVHGEPCALEALRVKINYELNIDVKIMKQHQQVILFSPEDIDGL
ncbi:MBL fold metallo-hydrolase RNA specificity domain-containing protein [Pedobacter insulae]|uniref:Metallo-beta-lactamase family protein n=1 Tax=Pedobacter insulae TaxID=414048 RepID=A0A1I2XFE4_9SPHI|nr:MBL fold metallo-hydrolase [Pedobacter insulae]SFH12155.1 metallo-beta-lactamase family protein [Pedobacter insulae]